MIIIDEVLQAPSMILIYKSALYLYPISSEAAAANLLTNDNNTTQYYI